MIGKRRRTTVVRWSEPIEAQRSRWAFFIGLLIQQIFMRYQPNHLIFP